MTVFIVSEHIEYEGWSLLAVHASETLARKRVWEMVEANMKENDNSGYHFKTTSFYEGGFGKEEEPTTNIVPFEQADGMDTWFLVQEYKVADMD